jgi:hypothetical protein
MLRATISSLVLALGLAGCGGGGGSSAAANPGSLVVTIEYAGGTLSGVPVTLSTGLNGQTPTGVITTTSTNSAGQATLSLPSDGTLCVSATETTVGGTSFAGNCLSQPFPTTLTLTLH